jgi:transposase, IS5 family
MYKSQSSFNASMFGSYALRKVIDRNKSHLLVRLGECIDLSFIEGIVEDCYCHDNGRPAYHPVMMFRILFLQALYDESDEKIMEAVDTNILFRYFVGLSLEDSIPDRTLLGKFKARLGEGRFNDIFNRIVSLAKEAGLVDNRLRLIDCTAIKANADLYRCKKDKHDDDDHTFIDRGSSDPDASTGYKTKHNKWYGYKSGIAIDAESEIVTAVETTTAKIADTKHLRSLTEKDIVSSGGAKRLCADKGFQGHNDYLKEKKITNNVIRRDNMKKPRRMSYMYDRLVRPIIEHKFAEGKKYHGLGKARYRGRWRVHIQSLLVYLVMNVKKLVNYLSPIDAK